MICPGAELFDLAQGRMGVARAHEVRAHIRGCAVCQDQLAVAEAIVAATVRLDTAAPVALEERMWALLEPEAELASARARKRAAWRELLGRQVLDVVELAWPRDGETGWRVWLQRLVWSGALAAVLYAVLAPDAVTEPPEAAAAPLVASSMVGAARSSALDANPQDGGDLVDGGVRAAVSPPRSLFPTTAAVTADAVPGVATANLGAVADPPALAPRHVRGWHHVASATSAADPPAGQALLACGAIVDLAEAQATLVRNLATDAEVELTEGRVVVRVPKLPPGGRLVVRTSDATVQVKGTAFAVDKRNKDWTTVEVFEGVVQVDAAGHGREPEPGRETFWLHPGDTKRIESVDAYLRRQVAELDDALAAGRLGVAHEKAQQYLTVAGPDGPDVDDVQLRLGGILSRTGHKAEAARLYRAVADGDGPVYARQNALAVLAVLRRDSEQLDAERATWEEYLARFPDGLYVREALVRQVEFGCARSGGGAPDAAYEQARRVLAARFGQEPTAAAVLERCRTR